MKKDVSKVKKGNDDDKVKKDKETKNLTKEIDSAITDSEKVFEIDAKKIIEKVWFHPYAFKLNNLILYK